MPRTLAEIKADLARLKGGAPVADTTGWKVDPEPLPPALARQEFVLPSRDADPAPDPRLPDSDEQVVAWRARELLRQRDEEAAKIPDVEKRLAGAARILSSPVRAATGVDVPAVAVGVLGGKGERARYERAAEGGVSDIGAAGKVAEAGGGLMGLSGPVGFLSRPAQAIKGTGMAARAGRLGVTSGAFGAHGAVTGAARAATGSGEPGAGPGEAAVREGLIGLGFGTVAGLGGGALREALDRLPMTTKRALVARIVGSMERGVAPAAKDVASLGRREVVTRALSEAGAMTAAGRVFHPGDASDDAINAFLGAVAGGLGHGPSTGFGRAEGPVVTEMRRRGEERAATSFRSGPGGAQMPKGRAVASPAPEAQVAPLGRSLASEPVEREAPPPGTKRPIRTRDTSGLMGAQDTVGGRPVRPVEPPPFEPGESSPFVADFRQQPSRAPAPERGERMGGASEAARSDAPSISPAVEYGPEAARRRVPMREGRPPVEESLGGVTEAAVGEAKAEYVRRGGDPAKVFSPERAAAVRGQTPEEAARTLAALPPERRPDGSIAAGYKPTTDALREGLIEPAAVETVKAATVEGVKTFSSGVDAAGTPYAIGIDPAGKVVEVQGEPGKSAREMLGFGGAPPAMTFLAARESGPKIARGVEHHLGRYDTRIENLGTPSAREFAERARRSVDLGGEARGRLSESYEPAFKAINRHSGTASALSRPVYADGSAAGFAPWRQMVEGRMAPRTPQEAEVVRVIGGVTAARLREAKAAGVEIEAKENTVPYEWHADGLAILRAGPQSEAWGVLRSEIAKASGMPEEAVGRILERNQATLTGQKSTGIDTGVRRAAFEFGRAFKDIPDEIVAGGQRHRILVTDPNAYLKQFVERGAARIGFLKAFGPDVEPLRERFISENQGKGVDAAAEFEKVTRGLHSLPIDPRAVVPGSAGDTLHKATRPAIGVVREGMMSASAVPNLFEFWGTMRDIAGTKGFAQASARTAKMAADWAQRNPNEAMARLKKMGVIVNDHINTTFDPSRPYESTMRATSGVIGAARRGVEFAQEVFAGNVSDVMAERMVARKGQTTGGEGDVHSLRRMGYSSADARRLAYGEGTRAEYDAFQRLVPRRAVGANTKSLDVSAFEQGKSRHVAWFNKYASMVLRDAVNTTRATAESWKRTMDTGDIRPAIAGTAKFVSMVAGKAAGNAAGMLALTYLFGGQNALSIRINEAKDDPWKFLGNSVLFGLFGGTYGTALRAATGDDNLSNISAPLTALREIVGAVTGSVPLAPETTRAYQDLSTGERFAHLLDRLVPVTRAFTTGAIATLYGAQDEGDRTAQAIQGFYRWKRDVLKDDDSVFGLRAASEFRANMRRASEAIRRGDTEEADRHIQAAIGVEGGDKEKARASILGRRILTKIDKEDRARLPELRRRIGEENYRRLEVYDRMLEKYAASLGGGKKRARGLPRLPSLPGVPGG